jgi:uncharacterized protein
MMHKRLNEVDALRGFALFGICVVNVPFLALPLAEMMVPPTSLPDQIAGALTELLFQGKFFLIFSFLFGWGAAPALGTLPEGTRYARRIAALAAIGLLHALLVFHGDILLLYALLAALLWPLRHLTPRNLTRLAIASAVIGAIVLAALALALSQPLTAATTTPGFLGTFTQATAARFAEWRLAFPFILLFNGPLAFGAFALGLAAARTGFLTTGHPTYLALRALARRWWPAAIALNLPYVLSQTGALGDGLWALAGFASLALAAPALSLCYVIAVIEASRAGWLGGWAAAAGRLSLSAYIGEGLLAGLLFNGYGFALYGQLGQASLFAIAVAIYLTIHLTAILWTRSLGQGPMERILSRLIGRRLSPAAPPSDRGHS